MSKARNGKEERKNDKLHVQLVGGSQKGNRCRVRLEVDIDE